MICEGHQKNLKNCWPKIPVRVIQKLVSTPKELFSGILNED